MKKPTAGEKNAMMTQEEYRLEVLAQNELPVEKRRCPLCGYTKADDDIQMDHRLCEERGGINFNKLPPKDTTP